MSKKRKIQIKHLILLFSNMAVNNLKDFFKKEKIEIKSSIIYLDNCKKDQKPYKIKDNLDQEKQIGNKTIIDIKYLLSGLLDKFKSIIKKSTYQEKEVRKKWFTKNYFLLLFVLVAEIRNYYSHGKPDDKKILLEKIIESNQDFLNFIFAIFINKKENNNTQNIKIINNDFFYLFICIIFLRKDQYKYFNWVIKYHQIESLNKEHSLDDFNKKHFFLAKYRKENIDSKFYYQDEKVKILTSLISNHYNFFKNEEIKDNKSKKKTIIYNLFFKMINLIFIDDQNIKVFNLKNKHQKELKDLFENLELKKIKDKINKSKYFFKKQKTKDDIQEIKVIQKEIKMLKSEDFSKLNEQEIETKKEAIKKKIKTLKSKQKELSKKINEELLFDNSFHFHSEFLERKINYSPLYKKRKLLIFDRKNQKFILLNINQILGILNKIKIQEKQFSIENFRSLLFEKPKNYDQEKQKISKKLIISNLIKDLTNEKLNYSKIQKFINKIIFYAKSYQIKNINQDERNLKETNIEKYQEKIKILKSKQKIIYQKLLININDNDAKSYLENLNDYLEKNTNDKANEKSNVEDDFINNLQQIDHQYFQLELKKIIKKYLEIENNLYCKKIFNKLEKNGIVLNEEEINSQKKNKNPLNNLYCNLFIIYQKLIKDQNYLNESLEFSNFNNAFINIVSNNQKNETKLFKSNNPFIDFYKNVNFPLSKNIVNYIGKKIKTTRIVVKSKINSKEIAKKTSNQKSWYDDENGFIDNEFASNELENLTSNFFQSKNEKFVFNKNHENKKSNFNKNNNKYEKILIQNIHEYNSIFYKKMEKFIEDKNDQNYYNKLWNSINIFEKNALEIIRIFEPYLKEIDKITKETKKDQEKIKLIRNSFLHFDPWILKEVLKNRKEINFSSIKEIKTEIENFIKQNIKKRNFK